jgi:hypothetical protein
MNAAEAQLEVASHLAEAQQQLARAVLALRGLSLFDQNTSTVGGAGAANGPAQRDRSERLQQRPMLQR